MVLFLDKHSNYLNNKIKQKIICIPFVLTSGDDHLSTPLRLLLRLDFYLSLFLFLRPALTIFVFIYNILETFVSVLWDHL